MFDKKTIENAFRGDIIGREIIFLDSAASTNDIALKTGSLREDPEGIVVIADAQTHGKGRMGRSWISPPGVNLYFSVLLKPPLPPADVPVITLGAGASVAKAIRQQTGLNALIKWPNDILIEGRKTGGILTEMKSAGGKISLLVVGIGINVNMPSESLPEDIRPFTTSLKTEKGEEIDRAALLGKVLSELEKTYKFLLNSNKRALINDWLGLNSTIGNKITVKNQAGTISGIAEGISDRGELLVRLSTGEVETVNAGDVTVEKIN